MRARDRVTSFALCMIVGLRPTAGADEPGREALAAPAAGLSSTQAAPPAGPPGGYWTGEWGSGGWGGRRGWLGEHGVELDLRLTQSYQGVVSGARANDGGYGGKFLTDFAFDFGRLAGWRGLSSQLLTELRWGAIPDIVGNKLVPTTYLITPKSDGTVFAITGLNVTQLVPIGAGKDDSIALGVGRYMGFDGADSPFHGGGGHTTFLHLAFNGTPTHGRLVPSVTNGANLAWVRRSSPFVTFSVRDATGHPTSPGLSDMFEDGATFIGGVNLKAALRGNPGQHSLVGMVTTKKLTPFDTGPGEGNPVEPDDPLVPKAGSWIVQYKMYQYLKAWKGSDGAMTGWGFFGTFVAADGGTNKSGLVLTVGLGGVPLASREHDRFGIAYSQDGVSLKYREQAKPFDLDSENVFEAFYAFALTPFFKLTADLQVIRPMLKGSGTAVLPGVRLVLDF